MRFKMSLLMDKIQQARDVEMWYNPIIKMENQTLNNTFCANCGEEEELADLSIDVALHPNDAGYQRMADELLKAFGKALDLTGCLMP